jgi:hypothetical protein
MNTKLMLLLCSCLSFTSYGQETSGTTEIAQDKSVLFESGKYLGEYLAAREMFYTIASVSLTAHAHDLWHQFQGQFNTKEALFEGCNTLYKNVFTLLENYFTTEESKQNIETLAQTIRLDGLVDLFVEHLFEFILRVVELDTQKQIRSSASEEMRNKLDSLHQYVNGTYASVNLDQLLTDLNSLDNSIMSELSIDTKRLQVNYSALLTALRVLYIAKRASRIGCVVKAEWTKPTVQEPSEALSIEETELIHLA